LLKIFHNFSMFIAVKRVAYWLTFHHIFSPV